MRRLAALLLSVLPFAVAPAAAKGEYVKLPGGELRSALKYGEESSSSHVAPFSLMRAPVTNAQYLAFAKAHPQWRRDRVPGVFAEGRCLSHWQTQTELGANALPGQPVVQVSWFAAEAYCKSQGARLPTWSEWEYAAAADETRRDARKDPAWRARILAWYSTPPDGRSHAGNCIK